MSERTTQTILIVEDDPMISALIKRCLVHYGYRALIAANGEAGLELAHAHLPDLILMDMALPLLPGWEAAKQLKAAPDTHHIPIIAVTAYALEEDQARAYAAGCSDFVAKPFSFEHLIATVRRYLPQVQPQSRS